jgi:calcineurin-like phosphoesterase family protein
MIYFTADCHFGHKNIIEYCERPFDNVHIMDQVMFDRINESVGVDDTLYILGDFCFKGRKPIEYRSRINCHDVHLILGNHDKRNDYKDDLQGFASVQEVKEIIYCNQRIYLSHYPHRSWPASHKGSFMLFGHVHGKLDHEDRASERKTLDVGVDNTINYNKRFGEPFSFKEIQKIMNSRTDISFFYTAVDN